jgi:hydrogenase nickel incorporation protein HypB
VDSYTAHIREVNPTATILPVSARTGDGMSAWFGWLRRFVAGDLP